MSLGDLVQCHGGVLECPDNLLRWGEHTLECPVDLLESCGRVLERVPERVPQTDDPPGKNAREHVPQHEGVDYPRDSNCTRHVNKEVRRDWAHTDFQVETPKQIPVKRITAKTVKRQKISITTP